MINPPSSLLLAGASLALWAGSASSAIAGERWHLDSFRAFAEGAFADSGVNGYVAADGSLRLINALDLNGDGLPDAFFPTNHAYGEKVDLSIFWDQPGYSLARRTQLPTEGGQDAAVADLNRDGHPHLVVLNRFDGTKNELSAWIYWGSAGGFSAERRDSLPAQGGEAVEIADLNGDGYPEIVIANSGLTYHVAIDKIQQSYIYWNKAGKFAADQKSILPTVNGRDVAIADLNGDKQPDIVLVSSGNEGNDSGARIFWGRNGTYDVAHSLFLPGEGAVATALGDLNGDGRPDLVLVNSVRLKGREAGIYDMVDTVQLDSTIYWNSAQGFSAANRTGLPTVNGAAAAIGDLDGDGYVDLVFANQQGNASYVYWNSAEGFQPRRRLALPTSNARSVAVADVNKDGHPEIFFANGAVGSNYDVESFIYWGTPAGPDAKRVQALPVSGPAAVLVADLTGRGTSDLIFISRNNGTGNDTPSSLFLSNRNNPQVFRPEARIDVGTVGPDSYTIADLNLDGRPDIIIPGNDGLSIYWNDSKNPFARANRTTVTSIQLMGVRVADFNKDGYLDLLPSEWSPGSKQTHIYYGGPSGFSTAARTALEVGGIRFHTIADFNKDGWIDVAFPDFNSQGVVIFWNGPSGFDSKNRQFIAGRCPVALETADLNGDGWLDLIVPNLYDKNPPPEQKMRAFGGSPMGDVFIYWGSAAGFSNDRRQTLPALGPEDAVVADLNQDGRLDLFITAYHGGARRDHPSYIYWQGPNGFDAKNVTMLETYSASGATASDYNADGYVDLLVSNHQRNGNHHTNSYLYWGSPQGFSEKNRLELPTRGVHLQAVSDHGEIYHRSHNYDYVSAPKQLKAAKSLTAFNWVAELPERTGVRFQIRSASTREGLEKAAWQGPKGENSAFESPEFATKLALQGEWVQFRATLSNPGGGLPVVKSVTLDFQ
jgi:hypothetical protein